ncbi:sec-independent protein translocase protein TatA [Streptomyces griseochromogenes]|uniref:Sec-independent protein translocase protein TatA n=1 Tax=Streptomyces griseochromogenes TaxID=68214 RepID=A0A1B1B159_9ACTN|nr:Sec-independent protein translocase subunit TatA [Streptomyces griseochromogenes]ANP52553.1 preprotein translocase subunit TatA [Streptomyces griseochromogenes]MBP2047117.1 sec-independent protein translocase protein TatA [Streptomyces griseochromogenes]
MFRNGLEPWHLLIVAIVIILVFGSKKLPDAARGLGKSMRILKSEAKAMKEGDARQAAAPAEGAPERPAPKATEATPPQAASPRAASEDAAGR